MHLPEVRHQAAVVDVRPVLQPRPRRLLTLQVAADPVLALREEAVHEGTDPEECVEAPNPILPEVNEIIWGGGAFLVLLVLMWWKLLPPIKQGLTDRQERIRTDLEAAETAKTDAEQVLSQYQAQVANAKAEANKIIEDARKTAGLQIEDRIDLRYSAPAEIAEAIAASCDYVKSETLALSIEPVSTTKRFTSPRSTSTNSSGDLVPAIRIGGR